MRHRFDLAIVCASPTVGGWNSCGPLLHQASKADEEAVADVGQAVLRRHVVVPVHSAVK